MTNRHAPLILLLACSLVGVQALAQASPKPRTGLASVRTAVRSSSLSAAGNGIDYHGGPVMLGPVKVYYIWYGTWAQNEAIPILLEFANNIGGSPYFNINTSYSDALHNPVSGAVQFGGSITDVGSRGKLLTSDAMGEILVGLFNRSALPADPNALYIFLGAPDIDATTGDRGLCTQVCGWHGAFHYVVPPNSTAIKYAFVGNPSRCPGFCTYGNNISQSPNGVPAADAMASGIAHELSEAVTDPEISAWYNASSGASTEVTENADLCGWNFGPTYRAANGSEANVRLGNRDYLLQQNWVNKDGGYCGMFIRPDPRPASEIMSFLSQLLL